MASILVSRHLKTTEGHHEKFEAIPFFWSQHYDVAINYVGHAESWDATEIDGNLDARDCSVTYKKGGRTPAVLTISRDLQSLQAEAAMEAETRERPDRSLEAVSCVTGTQIMAFGITPASAFATLRQKRGLKNKG